MGDLYLSAGKSGASASSTRGGLHLFRRTADGNAFQLIESSVNVSKDPPSDVFAYEYHPEGAIDALQQEPEGIDWWNRDNDPSSPYPGQLNAILLDNDVLDDPLWLKHYRVTYSCVLYDDSDSDGVSDGDEVYVYNTNPLLADTDKDGFEDAVDNCPLISNAGQADLDGDGKGDPCDEDIDADGQSNVDEQACGSNPLDVSSRSPDFDGDMIPDCVDPDDDDDGILDAVDACPLEDATGFDANGDGCIDTLGALPGIINALVTTGVVDSTMSKSLISKIDNANKSADKVNICTAVAQLEAFKNQLKAQRGHKISEDAADLLIAYADNLITKLLSALPAGEGC